MANVTFYDRVDDAIHNEQLQIALTRTTTALRTNRNNAFDALPESDELRDHARKIRAHTIANLDTYLGQFADAVEGLGGNVHFADTAVSANEYIINPSGIKMAV